MLRICSLIVFLCGAAQPLDAQDFSGQVRFLDADTLWVGRSKVRVFGIDAPEMDQQCLDTNGRQWGCGRWAAAQAKSLFDGKRAACVQRDIDRYGRIVATCRVDAADIAQVLVRQGLATAFTRYSTDYVSAEKEASILGVGIWQGSFQTPAQYRATTRAAPRPAPAAPEACAIKGNISKGGRIYHLPGQENYAVTVISPTKGERWFCSESEARAAGWRRAKR